MTVKELIEKLTKVITEDPTWEDVAVAVSTDPDESYVHLATHVLDYESEEDEPMMPPYTDGENSWDRLVVIDGARCSIDIEGE